MFSFVEEVTNLMIDGEDGNGPEKLKTVFAASSEQLAS